MINILPEFESRQVLTDDELNWLATYLDSQNRQSRMMLLGSGLLAGLQVRLEGSGIRLSNGVALTSAGHILAARHHTADFLTFTRQVKYEPREKEKFAFHYLTDDLTEAENYSGSVDSPSYFQDFESDVIEVFESQFNRGEPLNAAAAIGKVLMIYQEIVRKELKSCESTDCQDRGKKYEFNTRFLLVTREDALKLLNKEYGLQGTGEDTISRLAFPQLYLPDINILKPVLGNFPVNEQFDEARIGNEYKRCITDFIRFLSGNKQAIDIALKNLKNYTGRSNSDFRVADDLLAAIDRTGVTGGGVVQPYMCQVAYDLCLTWVRAYRELQRQARLLTSRVSGISASHPHHVFCGIVEPSNPEFDYPVSTRFSVYRHHFVSRFLQADQAHIAKHISVMLSRLKNIPNAFDEQSPGELKELRVISGGMPGGSLSDQAVPFYLRQEVVNVWKAGAAQVAINQDITRYGAHNESFPGTAASPFNTQSTSLQSSNTFFRIEGAHGQPALTALDTLFRVRKRRALPFDLVVLRLNEKSPANYSFNFSVNEDIESLYQVVRSELKKQIALNVAYLGSLEIQSGRFNDVKDSLGRQMEWVFLDLLGELNGQLLNKLTVQLGNAVQAGNIVASTRTTTIAKVQPQFAELENVANGMKMSTTPVFLNESLQKTVSLSASKFDTIFNPGLFFNFPFLVVFNSLGSMVSSLRNESRFKEATDVNFYTRLHDVARRLGNTQGEQVLFMQALRLYCALKLQDLHLTDNFRELDSDKFKANLEGLLLPACSTMAGELKKLNAEDIRSDNTLQVFAKAEMMSHVDRIRFDDDWVKVIQIDTENKKRNGSMGNDNLLERFVKAHPGLGHGFGVPQGGTYVLVYNEANRITADFSLPYLISSHLRPISYTLLEKKTLTLSGIVRDAAGAPLKMPLLVGSATVFSDEQGFYNALVSEDSTVKVIVKSDDYQYFEQEVRIAGDGQTLDIVLQKIETGFTTTLKFVNQLEKNIGLDILLVNSKGEKEKAASGELKIHGEKGSIHSFKVEDPRFRGQELTVKIGDADKEEQITLTEVGQVFFQVRDQAGNYDPALLKEVQIVNPDMALEDPGPRDGLFSSKDMADIRETPTVIIVYAGNRIEQQLKIRPEMQRIIVRAAENPLRELPASVLMLFDERSRLRTDTFDINGKKIAIDRVTGIGTDKISTEGQLKMDPVLVNCPVVKIENPENIAGGVVVIDYRLIESRTDIAALDAVYTFNRALTPIDIRNMSRTVPGLSVLSGIPDIGKLNSITLIMNPEQIEKIRSTLSV